MPDHIARGHLPGARSRVVAALTTDIARDAARRHGAVAGSSVALSRAATSALMLATLTKGEGEQVTLQVLGDGPLGSLAADATSAGDVRVYVKHPSVLVPGDRLGDGIGRDGVVSVARDLGLRERTSGQSPLVSGEIDEDVESYLVTSEQVPSALAADAVLGADGAPAVAGGLLVQCLPEGSGEGERLVVDLRRRLREGALSAALADSPADAAALVRAVIGGPAADLIVFDTRPVRFHCPCSRPRVADMLALLGESELDSMLREDGGARVTCAFCRERYDVSAIDLVEILEAVRRQARARS